jgi:hypothetical protein
MRFMASMIALEIVNSNRVVHNAGLGHLNFLQMISFTI